VSQEKSPEHLSPTAIGLAAGLVTLLAVGVVVVSLVLGSADDPAAGPPTTTSSTTTPPSRTGPVALVGVDAPAARSAACTQLLSALPNELPDSEDTLRRLPIADPAPPAALAWGTDRGDPVVLRCGLRRPAELTPTSALREVSKVEWLVVEGSGSSTWYVVDRGVYLALTMPAGTGTGPLQDVSAAVARVLPARPVATSG
jgi:hypothetical protein